MLHMTASHPLWTFLTRLGAQSGLRQPALCIAASGIVLQLQASLLAQARSLESPLLMPWMPSMGGLARSLPPDVHVVGFGKTVSVFSSKQKPKELTVYGSDFRCARLALAQSPFIARNGSETMPYSLATFPIRMCTAVNDMT